MPDDPLDALLARLAASNLVVLSEDERALLAREVTRLRGIAAAQRIRRGIDDVMIRNMKRECRGLEQRLADARAATDQFRDECARLRSELAGTEKARLLLMAGMESQCESMDGLKQEARQLRDRLATLAAACDAYRAECTRLQGETKKDG